MRYDKRTDKLQMIIGDGRVALSKPLENLENEYTRLNERRQLVGVPNVQRRLGR